LWQPRVIVEKQMECRFTGEIEFLGETLPQRHFCPSQNPTRPDPGLNTGRRGGKPAINRLIYGAAKRGRVPFVSAIFCPQLFPLRRTFSELRSRCERGKPRLGPHVK
jgi:hypothetical protein